MADRAKCNDLQLHMPNDLHMSLFYFRSLAQMHGAHVRAHTHMLVSALAVRCFQMTAPDLIVMVIMMRMVTLKSGLAALQTHIP
eukprot:1153481-Pelagomonas_calceolata.AAC.12